MPRLPPRSTWGPRPDAHGRDLHNSAMKLSRVLFRSRPRLPGGRLSGASQAPRRCFPPFRVGPPGRVAWPLDPGARAPWGVPCAFPSPGGRRPGSRLSKSGPFCVLCWPSTFLVLCREVFPEGRRRRRAAQMLFSKILVQKRKFRWQQTPVAPFADVGFTSPADGDFAGVTSARRRRLRNLAPFKIFPKGSTSVEP